MYYLSSMKFQWSIIQHELSSIDHQISSINHQVSSIKQKYRQSSIDYQLWNFKYRLSSLVILFNYHIWIIKFQVCIKYQLSSVNDPVQTESMVNNQISIMKMMKYEVYTGCLKKWGFCICLISWEPRNGFLNTDIHICKFWIQKHICALLEGVDICKTKCSSEIDKFLIKLIWSVPHSTKMALRYPNWLLTGLAILWEAPRGPKLPKLVSHGLSTSGHYEYRYVYFGTAFCFTNISAP